MERQGLYNRILLKRQILKGTNVCLFFCLWYNIGRSYERGDILERICKLQASLNRCQYLGENQKCDAPHDSCGMLIKNDSKQKPYVHKEKWFEKYYR